MDNSQAKYIDIDGINTRYFEAGEGEPMVLIHGGQPGMASSAEIWFLNFDELAKKYHVYALDKLGQGYTDNPKVNEDYTMGAQVKHAVGFMNKLNISNRFELDGPCDLRQSGAFWWRFLSLRAGSTASGCRNCVGLTQVPTLEISRIGSVWELR